MNSLYDFVNKCKMLDPKGLKTSDIDLHFIITYSGYSMSRTIMHPPRCLIRYEFLEFLIRCAKDKF